MTGSGTTVECQRIVEQWYQQNNDCAQRIIGSIIRRKGHHGEGGDEMRAELNYWICQHVTSAARQGAIGKVVLSMAISYAYLKWASGKRSYQNRQGRLNPAKEITTGCMGEEWQFPLSKRPENPAIRARYHLDMQTIGKRLSPKAQRVLREFITDPHATDKSVCEALGKGWHRQYVFYYRQLIKRALADAGYAPPPMRMVQVPPKIYSIGRTAACIYDACQRTPRASYVDIARRLGCRNSHVRWAVHRFAAMGVPWAMQFMEVNAQGRCQQPRGISFD